MPSKIVTAILSVAAAFLTQAVWPAGLDVHRMWDDRCFECHGHAGEFARKSLSVSNGELQGEHHVHDLRRFLQNHYLAASEAEAVYAMLLAQASSQARFSSECSGCHGRAAEFVRSSMELRDGVLYARDSGLPVRRILDHHRGLAPDDADFFAHVLTRIANEIYRP